MWLIFTSDRGSVFDILNVINNNHKQAHNLNP